MCNFSLQEAEDLLEVRLGLVIRRSLIGENEGALGIKIQPRDSEGEVALGELALGIALE